MDLLLASTAERRPVCTQASHQAAKATPSIWRTFQSIGYQPTYTDDESEPQHLEGRNCPHCNSSLFVEVQAAPLAGTLTTCFESFTHRGGRVATEWLWLYLPRDGERRFLGLVVDMTEQEARAMAATIEARRAAEVQP